MPEPRPPDILANRTLGLMDNLRFLLALPDGCIDLIPIDPPFGKMETFKSEPKPPITDAELAEEIDLFTAHTGKGKSEFPEFGLYTQVGDLWEWNKDIGQKESHAAFYREIANAPDGSLAKRIHSVIEAVIATANYNMAAYICFMAQRLVECHRVLKDTGSIYVHCDWQANSYLRMLLDAIFGNENFRNEIVWCYTGPSNIRRWFPRKHDTILFYAKSEESIFYRDAIRVPYKEGVTEKARGSGSAAIWSEGHDEERIADLARIGKIPEDWWTEEMQGFSPVGRSGENTGYSTQKPLALYRRIIEASTKPNDVVLDIFAGCATTAVAAEGWLPEHEPRQWIACDMSYRSLTMIKRRFYKNGYLLEGMSDATPAAYGEHQTGWADDLEIKPWAVIGPGDVTSREQVLPGPDVSARQQRDQRWTGNIPKAEAKGMLLEKHGVVCWGCNWQPKLPNGTDDPAMLEVEHLFAKRPDDGEEGGDDNLYNLGIACGKCNGVKGNRLTMTQLRDDRALKGLVWMSDEDKRPHLDRARQWAIREWSLRPRQGKLV